MANFAVTCNFIYYPPGATVCLKGTGAGLGRDTAFLTSFTVYQVASAFLKGIGVGLGRDTAFLTSFTLHQVATASRKGTLAWHWYVTLSF